MGESDLQAIYNKNNGKCPENFDSDVRDTTAADHLEDLVKSLLKCGKVHDALNAYINAYSSDFLDATSLEIFVDGLVQKTREIITKDVKFNVSYFLCSMCCDVMTDPVTLKCGHTFSKKCILSTAQSDFVCKKCSKSYTHAYISQLKSNVKISSIIEKFMKAQHADHRKNTGTSPTSKVCDSSITVSANIQKNAILSEADAEEKECEALSATAYMRKGDLLVKFEEYEECIKSYLISFTLDPNLTQAKENAIKHLHKLLLKQPSNLCGRNFSLKETASTNVTLKNAEFNDYSLEKERRYYNEDEEKEKKDLRLKESMKRNSLHDMLNNFFDEIKIFTEEEFVKEKINPSCLDKRDFECALCIRILWEPVSTQCGHTFCRSCLNRCFDHQTNCPLCKASLTSFLAERIQNTTIFLEKAIQTLFPNDYAERKALHEEEMEELSNAGKDSEPVIPLFVCTIAYPTVPCPLHVFEPRYRLMIRQCMESGSRQFGMCAYIDNNIAEYGTMLEIRDVQYFPDGRSAVDTIGSKRFRILRKGERDGYSTGAVEFLKDEPLHADIIQDVIEMHDQVYKISQSWFMHLPRDTKQEILQHMGPMPEIEAGYISSANGPSWFWWMLAVLPIEPKSRLMILSMTSLPRRLQTLYRVLLHLQSTIVV
ncbi:LON peptidase N-terminal domain and RING finger protein 3 [Trichonephila clavata]|uniref:LON peptidase N-terminal domain and RING finger protein 3 n=1 Tax=Trichonephila clavata TaxID=2740835 RepID=A0A8X6G5B2_TRICU|nr:LON peptidase N-terminal domain and RING finger protein 3 [Trichonephila clavata]